MAFLIKNGVIINDARELVGVNTAGITTALYVGENIQLDAQSGVITATKYEGSGADLTDIVATVIVSDGIPTGITTAEGDLYYDSTDLTLFTYYDNNWVDAAPVPPGATELEITNAAGISTVKIDLLSEALKLEGTDNEVTVALNPGTDSVTFGLASDVAIAGSMTANKYYGDGSGLTNLAFESGQFIQLGGVQAGVLTATNSLQATGTGVGLSVTNDAFIGGTVVTAQVNVIGTLRADTVEAVGSGQTISFADNVLPFTDAAYDLGSPEFQWDNLYVDKQVSAGGSITANEFYGDGSNLSGVLSTDGGGDANLDGHLEVVSIEATGAGTALTVTNNANIGGSLTLDGVANLNGGANLGNSSTDLVGFNGRVITDIIPLINDNVDLGSATNQWQDIFLSGNVSAGASITAANFYGDGSNLTGVGLATDSSIITTGDIQAGVITATTSLEATGTGVGLDVTNNATIGGTLTVSGNTTLEGNTQLGNFITDSINAIGKFVSSIEPIASGSYDLGDSSLAWRDLYFTRDIDGGGTGDIVGINSVTASEFYGDGSGLTGIEGTAIAYNTIANDSENNDLPMPFLSAVGAGASMYTDSSANEEFTYNPSTGILKVKEFDALSDARLKTDITGIEGALDKVASLRGVEYDWKNGSGSSVGVIAQEVQEVYPQLVNDNGERLTVNYNGLVGLLIAAVNEMSAELAELKAQK